MSIRSIIVRGSSGLLVDIECHLSNNLPNIVIVGCAAKTVTESRERIRGAFASSRIMLPRKRVIINLAPADIPKTDSGFDLAIAVAIMQASGQVQLQIDDHTAIIGELGLDGSIRPVRGIIGKLLYGRTHGIETFIVPAANMSQAQLVPHTNLIAANSLSELFCHLSAIEPLPVTDTQDGIASMSHNVERETSISFADIAGHTQAKRALEIAAAGGHNILLSGPPGTGKSMLAKAMHSILPPLTREEMLEVTHMHSLASSQYERLVTERPFRSPHHSASLSALCGGGSGTRPGEISLAHHGVLFLDEFPEFNRYSLEALRQPLEDKAITIARGNTSSNFPANFMLLATANPCPCGYYGTKLGAKTCICSESRRLAYERRLSGPILDRIDLFSHVEPIAHEDLLTHDTSNDNTMATRIARTRHVQQVRSGKLNSNMTNADISQHAQLTSAAASLLNHAARTTHLSARAYYRTVKIARTIADMEQIANIGEAQVSEALYYKKRVAP